MSKARTLVTPRRLGFGAGIAVATAVALWCVLSGRGAVVTENAYVKANKYSLSADVAGRIAAVPVRPNQSVSQGQVLVQLDDTPFRIAVAEAEAHLAQVSNDILARRADYAEAEAQLQQAREDASYFERKLARNEKMGPVAVSESQLDEARQQLSAARSQIAVNRQKLSRLKAELGGDPELPVEQQADIMVAQAQLDDARYKLSRTTLVAPADGIVANEVPQVGEMAPAGFSLISMIGTADVWVEANLKETQLAAVRPGQPARVTVDAYPGREWRAEVESLSPASGSEFALIPAQNASGNWVKVVQRIPVHLRLRGEPGAPLLRAGMSAQVRIDTAAGDVLATRSTPREGQAAVLAAR
ncbi:HlyD family secretion protein [Seongchinamella sediminis]|uniref:HlyD family secretion protein n=1 Tax=Seongchinamella sediminis TaxID=2283635 RepID=UPI0019681E9B|nr:HlyD family secretion protein [Seongchinamella sediminis]